jgi:hypothetical protein
MSETASLHERQRNQWIHPAIIACCITELMCEAEGQPTAAVCGLPTSQSSPGEELKFSPTDLGDARQDLGMPIT